MMVTQSRAVAILALVTAATAINRPVHKVVLDQKGFTQFLQYDVETPPIREFTFCTWIKVYNFNNEQSIFTYIVNGNKRVVRLWLDSGGRHLKVLFNERELSSVLVAIGQNVWRHICLSYQSDFGAWALYLDSRLISCEAAQRLQFFVLPAGGSVILGYGTNEQGNPTGLEGEIFGANILLSSTIGRNITLRNHPQFVQKAFQRNKLRGSKNIDYVVLSDLDTEESPNSNNETKVPLNISKTNSFIKVHTPNSHVKHEVGVRLTSVKPTYIFGSSASHESEILDMVMNPKPHPTFNPPASHKNNIWNSLVQTSPSAKFNVIGKKGVEQSKSETNDFPMLSEFETPPPPRPAKTDHLGRNVGTEKLPSSIYNLNNEQSVALPNKKHYIDEISEVEVPPPPVKDKKVYGHWTSSKYAGSVLNYLKSINFYSKEKKIPTTIPLMKVSDNFPYASSRNARVVRPPTNLLKKNMLAEKRLQDQYAHPSTLKRLHVIEKRDISAPEINVKILEDDTRSEIQKSHAKTHAKNVEVTNRGQSQNMINKELYNPYNNQELNNSRKPRQYETNIDLPRGYSLFNVLPFLKSFEYFTGDDNDNFAKSLVSNNYDMYGKSFSSGNKWHNIKTYNNDYTPRRVPEYDNSNQDLDQKIAEANKRHPSIRLKYKPESNKVVHDNNEEPILKGRKLAMDVSNQANNNKDVVSIVKYNHGFLPGHSEINKHIKSQHLAEEPRTKHAFNKHIKIGNALNERSIIGSNEEIKKESFLGGNENVPDIQRYRSDIESETQNVPPSLKPRVCRNVELLDNLLYVHPDGSINMSRIVSPLQTKNIALEFIVHNYKKCSLDESPLERNFLLLIHWSKTPVRLFGGAVTKRTKDLCGFF